MAIEALIPKLWSARFTFNVQRASTFINLVNANWSGEIQAAGNSVEIPTYTGDVTVKDHNPAVDLDDPELPDATTQTLLVDQQKYFSIGMGDVAKVQTLPNIMDQHMERAAYKAGRAIDAHLITRFTAKSSNSIALDIGSYDTLENRVAAARAFTSGLIDLKRTIREADLPFIGWWAVITPRIASILEEYLAMGGNVQLSTTGEAILARGLPQADGSTPAFTYGGFNIWVSNDISTRTNVSTCKVGTNAAVTYANQITMIEGLRNPKKFQDIVRGLYVYGSKLVENQFLYDFKVTLAAT